MIRVFRWLVLLGGIASASRQASSVSPEIPAAICTPVRRYSGLSLWARGLGQQFGHRAFELYGRQLRLAGRL
jgi:hypothetical protein